MRVRAADCEANTASDIGAVWTLENVEISILSSYVHFATACWELFLFLNFQAWNFPGWLLFPVPLLTDCIAVVVLPMFLSFFSHVRD